MTRGRPKEFDQDGALERALETFWSRGYGATGIGELTDAMGIGRQSLYDTFGDKRALFLQALTSYCEKQHGMLSSILAGAGTPGERLGAFLDAWGDLMAGPMRNGCMVISSISEFAGAEDQEVLDRMREAMARMAQLIEAVVQAAIEAGEVRVGLDAKDVTQMLLAAAHGLAAQARLSDVSDDARAAARSFKTLLGL